MVAIVIRNIKFIILKSSYIFKMTSHFDVTECM
jgi:hypothetical protein